MTRRRVLTPEQVREIREWDRARKQIPMLKDIARKFGVSDNTVKLAAGWATYKDVR